MAYEDTFRSIKVKSDVFVGGTLTGPGLSNTPKNIWYVDGNKTVSSTGKSWGSPFITIQEAVTAASVGDIVYIQPINMAAGATDPGNYAEAVVIPATKAGLSLIGVTPGNRTQGGLPQIKAGGASHTYCVTIRAPGCLIANLGFNGNSGAGAPINGAILLDDDNSTKTCIGTTIMNCHFKNCAGSTITDCRTGGAIDWSSNGGGWQIRIVGNRFYKNACDVALIGTAQTVPQDVIIEDNVFSGPTASVDTQLWLAGGSGINGLCVRNNVFPTLGTLGSAVVKRFIDATGCVGEIVNNKFGSATGTATGFGVAKTLAKIPTTMFMMHNYTEAGLITREA